MNLATFVEILKRSELIEPDRLRRMVKASVLSTEGSEATPQEVGDKLVNAGLLTDWQLAQMLKGKYRGFRLGKYIMRRPLGRGGMGVVYEAEHEVLNTRVAIKMLPKAKNEVEKSVGRFLAEARAAAKLNHVNLTRVHDCDVIDGRRFMVMELVPGTDLGELVDRNGKLAIRLAITLCRQAALGLQHAHDNGVIHRDVKPQNFLVNKEGELKVTDLGLALFQVDTPERYTQDGENTVVGTVDFVAPEQAWESTSVDRRADIYSLGCTLYFMLTGEPPFNTGSMAQRIAKHQTATARPLRQVRPDCPAAVEQLCWMMMAKKPADRIQNMSDVADACEELIERMAEGTEDSFDLSAMIGPRQKKSRVERERWHSAEVLGLRGSGDSADGVTENQPPASDEMPDFANLEDLNEFVHDDTWSDTNLTSNTVSNHSNSSDFWTQPVVTTTKPAKNKSSANSPSILEKISSSQGLMVLVSIGVFFAIAALGFALYDVYYNSQDVDPVKFIKTTE